MHRISGWPHGRPPLLEPLEPRLLLAASPYDSQIVINEIHYNPDVKTEAAEFVELYNTTSSGISLAGWQFTDGITFTFPNFTLAGHGYAVIAKKPSVIQNKFGVAGALGPWTGDLSNDGEQIVLRDAGGSIVDEVDYQLGFPWPTVGDPPGHSIELINPAFDNSLGGNWRSGAVASPGQTTTLIPAGSTWHYRKGTSEASSPISAWRGRTFTEDSTWLTGPGLIGYDPSLVFGTPLTDMYGGYMSVYLRETFTVNDLSQIGGLQLVAQYDDGFNAWINGTRVAWAQVPKEDMLYNDAASGPAREDNSWVTFTLPNPALYLVQGTNVLAVQFHNVNLSNSSDAFFDAKLQAMPPPSGSSPTPGRANSIYAANAAPQMRQVSNSPQQPTSGQAVAITAKVTDPDGVQSVTLEYQLVDPGNYIAIEDAAYSTGWTSVVMNDSGINGDATAGDGVYTAVLPPSIQTNRRLVRYRITAVDNSPQHLSIRAPYLDDPQPNFAYFVYDGVPGWSGADQPAVTPVVNYGQDVMRSIPSYVLLTKNDSVMHSQYLDKYGGDAYLWSGTLVYDGQVYDNIHYRARGGVWRYAMGKNMWKFDFNRGHSFQARDNYGRPYEFRWNKLNLGACIQQGDYWHRGEQGMFESVSFRLFNLAGVPAVNTNFVEFRVVDSASDTGATQYDGDFWGLYMAVEQEDGRFLDQHGLPDGNFYKMEGGSGAGGGSLSNQGPTQPTDNSDLVDFTNTYLNTTPTDQWWRDNLDLAEYYSYRAVVEGIHHGDVGYGKNYFYYHDPVTGKWSVHPWDTDLTWADNMYGDGNDPFKGRVLPRAAFNLEYQNRLREIRDLLFNTDQTYQLIDEMASFIHDPSGLSIVDADRAMWDYNPIMANSSYVNLSKAGQGRFYQGGGGQVIPAPGGFLGMVQKMKNYVVTRSQYIDSSLLTDTTIPNTPTLTYNGPANHALNRLTFHASNFSGYSGRAFGAMRWRIAEVTDPANPTYDPAAPKLYEVNPAWQSGELTIFSPDITIPAAGLQAGHTYRVRVQMEDSTGRWSHWSAPSQFVAGTPAGSPQDSLRVTEVMYHPQDPTLPSPYVDDNFQYVELQNTGQYPVNLQGVRLSVGLDYTFPNMTLAAGQRAVVAQNLGAFVSRYGTGLNVAGQFTGVLSKKSGEIRLDTAEGVAIQDFTYSDGWHPQTDGDGFSLVVRDAGQDPALWGDKDGWRSSMTVGGAPGKADPGLNPDSVVINELMVHTDVDPPGDWIELRNTTTSPIDISGWFLSDDPAVLAKFQIPAGTVLQPNGTAVFTQYGNFGLPGNPGALVPFAFSELGGESACLTSAAPDGSPGGYREVENFDAGDREVTFGRYIKSTGGQDFTPTSASTYNAPNAYPLVGPVVINEVMYMPSTSNYEFIELRNLTGSEVKLYDILNTTNTWKFIDGVQFTFPMNARIPANGYALVVGTDPAAFRSKYGIPAGVNIWGPYTGVLNDAGETVELVKPGNPELDGTVPYYRVDRVTYGASAPWPAPPTGGGVSLQRLVGNQYGNDVDNWALGPTNGTPGAANTGAAPLPRVVAVQLNGREDRGPSAIDPGGTGVRMIEVRFNQPVTFAAGDVLVQKVTFPGGVEAVGATIVPVSVTGSGTDAMTIMLPQQSALDTWVKVTLSSAGGLRDLSSRSLDGEARAGGSGRGYVYDTSDLPTGNGTAGGAAVFYVGSLRGDFRGTTGIVPDGQITTEDFLRFRTAFDAASPDADFRSADFDSTAPDGRLTIEDIDGFAAAYQQARSASGWGLSALPAHGGPAAAEVVEVSLPPVTLAPDKTAAAAPRPEIDLVASAGGLVPTQVDGDLWPESRKRDRRAPKVERLRTPRLHPHRAAGAVQKTPTL